jgi:glycosyltransferase 2 family protein
MQRMLPFFLKVAISIAMLYLAFRLVNFSALQDRLTRLDFKWIAAALLILSLQFVLGSLRWYRIAKACGSDLDQTHALIYTFIGAFFNQVTPSTVGGDAVRIWLMARRTHNWKSAIYSVFIDRVVGLIWLALIVLVCLPWSLALIQNPIGRIALILIGVCSVAGPLALFAISHIGQTWLHHWRYTRHLAELAAIVWKVFVTVRVGGAIGVISVALQLMNVLVAWLCAKAIGSPLDLINALLLIPPVILIAAVPVSIAGWGVREGAMVAAFTFAGLPDSDALTISVLLGACTFAISALGGLVWIFSGERGKIPAWPTAPPAASS